MRVSSNREKAGKARSYGLYRHLKSCKEIIKNLFRYYISSMRKTSEEFNSDTVIENIGYLCGKPELTELPYWETINDYLKRLDPAQLQEVVCRLVSHLIRSHAFDHSRVRGRYWQVILDGTQLESSRRELDPRSLQSRAVTRSTEGYWSHGNKIK